MAIGRSPSKGKTATNPKFVSYRDLLSVRKNVIRDFEHHRNISTRNQYHTKLGSMEVSDRLFRGHRYILENDSQAHGSVAVLTMLKDRGLNLKLEKVFFLKTLAEYLGHIVSSGCLYVTSKTYKPHKR